MDDTIARFRRMAEADPHNELAQFSLGKALLDARRYEEAVTPLERVIALNPDHSRAYQLLGSALKRLDRREQAIDILRRGFAVADTRGDVMPRDVMGKLLESLGQIPPPVQTTTARKPASHTADQTGFACRRCGATTGRLAEPPFRGPLGTAVQEHTCATCWEQWVGVGTKVINELHLRLANPDAQAQYDHHMREFLNLADITPDQTSTTETP